MSTRAYRAMAQPRVRPGIISGIAMFQFLKCAAALVFLAITFTKGLDKEAAAETDVDEQTAQIQFMQAYAGSYGVGSAVIGIGLWYLQKWARYALLFSSGIGLLRFGRAAVASLIFRSQIIPTNSLGAVLIVVDIALFTYLSRWDVRRAFDVPDGDM